MSDALDRLKNHVDEKIAIGAREIYVTYPHGNGQSKLVIHRRTWHNAEYEYNRQTDRIGGTLKETGGKSGMNVHTGQTSSAMIPTPAELIARSATLVDDIAARAAECEFGRRVPEETVAQFKQAELHKALLQKTACSSITCMCKLCTLNEPRTPIT